MNRHEHGKTEHITKRKISKELERNNQETILRL